VSPAVKGGKPKGGRAVGEASGGARKGRAVAGASDGDRATRGATAVSNGKPDRANGDRAKPRGAAGRGLKGGKAKEPARPRSTASAPPPGAHDWVSFPDPDEDRTWVVDVTFLLSHWQCIYGAGCQGVLTGPAPELEQGCCSYGAHFTGDEDVERVLAAAATLTTTEWQHHRAGHRRDGSLDVLTNGPDGATVTRQTGGACLFLNRPGFAGGAGCALHAAALQRGERPMDLKPDVCWQLPLRREDETDSTGHVTSVVCEWDRRHWGEGGLEFHWWCTEAPEAFTGRRAVYEELSDELCAMVGEQPYRLIIAELERRRAAATAPLPHPAAVPIAMPTRKRP
jgi:hypothetical protein